MHTFYCPEDNTEDTVVLLWMEGAQIGFNEDATLHHINDATSIQHVTETVSAAQGTGQSATSTAAPPAWSVVIGTMVMPQAFDGIRVLELGQIYNGPYCGLLLAQLGADVIKIEPPGGEQLRFRSHQPIESHEFVMLKSNKRSVVLNLKTDAGRQALLDFVETADV